MIEPVKRDPVRLGQESVRSAFAAGLLAGLAAIAAVLTAQQLRPSQTT